MTLLCSALAAGCSALGQSVDLQKLDSALSNSLRWSAFWDGTSLWQNYVPNQNRKATVVQIGPKLGIYIDGIGTLTFSMDKAGAVHRGTLRVMRGERNSAVETLINSLSPGGFKLVPGAARVDLPNAEIGPMPKPIVSETELRLPLLEPPESILNRQSPRDLAQFIALAVKSVAVVPHGWLWHAHRAAALFQRRRPRGVCAIGPWRNMRARDPAVHQHGTRLEAGPIITGSPSQ